MNTHRVLVIKPPTFYKVVDGEVVIDTPPQIKKSFYKGRYRDVVDVSEAPHPSYLLLTLQQ